MVIGLLSIIDANTLTMVTVFSHPIIYYVGILSILLASVSTSNAPTKNPFDTKKYLREVIKDTHYRPSGLHKPAGKETFREITGLYQYRIVIFLISILGLFIGPLWLIISLPRRAESILEFIRNNTTNHAELGYICTFSNFEEIENSTGDDKIKMEKSLLSYQRNTGRELDV
jgi:hypothetical protein